MSNKELTYSDHSIHDFELVKEKVLNWTQQFSTFCFLDNHQYQLQPHTVECILAAGSKRSIAAADSHGLEKLEDFINAKKGWCFGHLAYDLKNDIEGLSSSNPDGIGFPGYFFFEPEYIIRIQQDRLIIEGDAAENVYRQILAAGTERKQHTAIPAIRQRFAKEEYIDVIRKLKEHILRGDCYEINFCQEFYAEQSVIDPTDVYKSLSRVSPNPFSALYRSGEKWLICASPERFLKKTGNRILSQPIKGTSKRVPQDDELDEASRTELKHSEKDRSENVMVVDIVRNDLSRVCREGTVKADELFGVYSFPQVHQMISTVSGELKEEVSFTDIIRATFPMGSMTGAPKRRVMELIEQCERTKRGIFSGALGYISPEGDFDFNVVIRSVMYNEGTKYLSFQAGSGITWYSDPEKEWEECLMKASAIKEVLNKIE